MGKYMRRKRGAAGAGDSSSKAAPAAVLGGIRTRSRSAAATTAVVVEGPAKRRKQAAETTTARVVDEAVCGHDGGAAGCYLRLRSRRLLFKPAEEEASTARMLADSGDPGEAVVVGISRCSGTASSTVDVAATRRRGGEEAEACDRGDVESSVSDSECAVGRERRETTPSPSSRPPVGSTTDQQKRKRCCRRNSPTTATTRTRTSTAAALRLEPRARMPEAEEIERFFAAADKAQAERFAAEYNLDVALGVPLNAGRFEWTPVTTT